MFYPKTIFQDEIESFPPNFTLQKTEYLCYAVSYEQLREKL